VSGRLVGEVLKYAPYDLTPTELLVLIALAESAHDRDRIARYHASAEHLANLIRSPSPASIRNVLARLTARALIVPLIEKCHRGVAQQYRIAPLNEGTRKAVLAQPHSGAINGHKRNPTIAHEPVDNPNQSEKKAQRELLEKRNPQVAPPGTTNTRINPVPRTQVGR
jgi:hypothetical protein